MRFDGSVVVVTGGGSGIGRVVAKQFAREGAKVLVADRIAESAEMVATEITEAGGAALPIETDVSVACQVKAMAAAARRYLGAVDVLVNNAAVASADDLVTIDEKAWDHEVSVDLKSAFLCAKEVLPDMIARHQGSIVNITSVNGLFGLGLEPYSAAKAGLISLTQNLAVRYGHYGIRANAVAPGTIRTPSWQRLETDPELFRKLISFYPLERVGEPEDVAHAVLFLASDEAAWITGTVLRVDGGLLAGSGRLTEEIQAAFGDSS